MISQTHPDIMTSDGVSENMTLMIKGTIRLFSRSDRTLKNRIEMLATISSGSQLCKFLCREAGVMPAGPRRPCPPDIADGPGEASVLAPTRGDDGYASPGASGAASYIGRLGFLALCLLLDGGGVESVSFELARLDATASSSSVSDELGSFGCEKRLAGGTMTESAVVDDGGMRTEERRPEEELVSGTGTPYRPRGSARADILGLMAAGADGVE